MANDYDVIVVGGGLAGRALRRGAGRRRPAGRAGRARARRRRVLLLRLHPVEDAAAPGRGGAGGARRVGDRRGRRRGGAGLARLHGLELLRRRPGALAGRAAASTCSAAAAGSRGRASSRSTAPATPPTRRPRGRRRPVHPAGPGAARARGRVDQPRGDRHEGRAAPAARPRRRAGRRRDGAGRAALRRRGGRSSRAPSTCSPASPRRWARRSARSCARDGIELVLGVHATAARREGDDYVLEFEDGRELRGDRLLVATGPAPAGRGDRPGDGGHRARRRTGSRSTPTCAPASACGRSATSPASGR